MLLGDEDAVETNNRHDWCGNRNVGSDIGSGNGHPWCHKWLVRLHQRIDSILIPLFLSQRLVNGFFIQLQAFRVTAHFQRSATARRLGSLAAGGIFRWLSGGRAGRQSTLRKSLPVKRGYRANVDHM